MAIKFDETNGRSCHNEIAINQNGRERRCDDDARRLVARGKYVHFASQSKAGAT